MQADLLELLRCPLTGASLLLDAYERDADRVRWGVLRGPVQDYPILDGVVVVRGGDDEALGHLRRGDHHRALAAAISRDLALSRWGDLTGALRSVRPTRWLGKQAARRARDLATARAVDALRASGDGPEPVLHLAMLEGRRPNPEGFLYFRYRLGLPRHLVALSCICAATPDDRPVLEIGAGAGHLTWLISAHHSPRPVVAIERELYLLWVARHFVAPGATLVCGDARALPLATDSCSLAVAVDVLSFVSEKASAVRELERVVGPAGGLVITSVINADAEHEFAGEPLDPDGWAGLLGGTDRLVLDDDELLDRYLAGHGPPDRASAAPPDSRTISILAGPAALAGVGEAFADWPHDRGRLGPHPLLGPADEPAGPNEDRVRLARRLPSPGFGRDNPGLARYLPRAVDVSRSAIDDARAGRRSSEVRDLLSRIVLIGYPETFAPDPWLEITPAAG